MISDEQQLATLVMNAYHREVDILMYQTNIDNYNHILENLPQGDWDEDIAVYRTTPLIELPHSLTDDQFDRYTQLQYRDHMRFMVRTEKTEQSKTKLIRDALKAKIGDNYDLLLQEYKATQV